MLKLGYARQKVTRQFREPIFDPARYDASRLGKQTGTANSVMAMTQILVKPLSDSRFGSGLMRITTSLPKDNETVVAALRDVL
jgi:histidinol-phosphate/aromatic aminotransferase/cobyric acid decarboxylase-like protein